jgi:acid stress-induced BolA-like protein IbaG/YrbA
VTLEEIKYTIKEAVPQATIYVMDPLNDGQHLQAIVVSPIFEGMLLVKQHQMVMRPLKEAFQGAVHALALKTFTPQKWQEVKAQFGF